MAKQSPLEKQLGREQIDAYGLTADLMALPREKRRLRVRNDLRCQTASFIELALTLSRERDRDRDDARLWIQIAIDAAEGAKDCRAAELLPLAWAVLGNHYRCSGELRRAGSAFTRCRQLHVEIADPLERAECLSLEASYWREMRQFRFAEQNLDEAQEIAALFGGPHLKAKLHVKQGAVAAEAESWETAIYHLRVGAELASETDQPALVLGATHNIAHVLVELGVYDWAAATLCDLQPLYRKHGTDKQALQSQWLMARCALGRHNPAEARARLRKVRDDFLTCRDLYYASLVELDLVEAHALLCDWRSAQRAAAAAASGLSTVGATAEALVAIECVKDGLRQRLGGQALLGLVADARTRVRAGL